MNICIRCGCSIGHARYCAVCEEILEDEWMKNRKGDTAALQSRITELESALREIIASHQKHLMSALMCADIARKALETKK